MGLIPIGLIGAGLAVAMMGPARRRARRNPKKKGTAYGDRYVCKTCSGFGSHAGWKVMHARATGHRRFKRVTLYRNPKGKRKRAERTWHGIPFSELYPKHGWGLKRRKPARKRKR